MANVLKFSDAASLAMHAMVLLAKEPATVHSTHDIAGRLQVSEAHLSKVLQRLCRGGLVRSERGPKGGFQLEHPERDVSLLDVFEAIEGRLEPSVCLLGTRSCTGLDCILGSLLRGVDAEVRDHLEKTRLSQLTGIYGRNES